MHRLTYRWAALVTLALLAALVGTDLPARGAPPPAPRTPVPRVLPQRQPVQNLGPTLTLNALLRDPVIRYEQALPSLRNLNASLIGNPTITPFSGLSPVPPYSPSLGFWQSAYGLPYWSAMSEYSLNSYLMNSYSMYGYGSAYSSYGSGYSGGGGGSSGDASSTDYARYFQATARPERQNVPAGPLSGLMKADGGLDWPLALRILPSATESAELRRHLDTLAAELPSQGSGGKADDRLANDMNRDLDRLTSLLAEKGDRLPVSEQALSEARQFLQKIRQTLKSAE